MTFLTNQLTWSPETIAELYRCRWEIEVSSSNSSRRCSWQTSWERRPMPYVGRSGSRVIYLLLRYLAYLSNWAIASAACCSSTDQSMA